MTYNVFIETRAREELEAATIWYEENLSGLGIRFTDAFSDIIDYLEKNAHSHPKIEGEYRQLIMKKFPYFVIYKIENDAVKIIAVFHTSRNPENKI